MPADSRPLTRLPHLDLGPDRINSPGNLMSWNTRILNARPQPFLDQRITVADAARFDFNAHLSASGLRDGTFDHLKIAAGFCDLHCFHASHFRSVLVEEDFW